MYEEKCSNQFLALSLRLSELAADTLVDLTNTILGYGIEDVASMHDVIPTLLSKEFGISINFCRTFVSLTHSSSLPNKGDQ